MRMWPYVHAGTQQKFSGTHLIEEDKRPHHLPLNLMAATPPHTEKPPRSLARGTITTSITS